MSELTDEKKKISFTRICDYCGKSLTSSEVGSAHYHCLEMEDAFYENAEPFEQYKTLHQMIMEDDPDLYDMD